MTALAVHNGSPDEEFKIDTGRTVDGSFVCVTHVPTGISVTESPVEGGRIAAAAARLRDLVTELVQRRTSG